jgi:thioesterase domain-containing protein
MQPVNLLVFFFLKDLISFFAIGYTDPTMTGDSRSVRELAQSYVKMIKQVQRHGPYFLGGYSFGGLIAYEMASLLVEEGEEVSFLAMLDTFPWEMSNRTASDQLEFFFGDNKLERTMYDVFQVNILFGCLSFSLTFLNLLHNFKLGLFFTYTCALHG